MTAGDNDDVSTETKLQAFLKPDPNFQPDILDVYMGEDQVKWSKQSDKKMAAFLELWVGGIRDSLPAKVLPYYQEQRAEFLKYSRTSESELDQWTRFSWPDSETPEQVAELFKVNRLHFRDDGDFGLECECTWDEEHGFGVLIREGKIAEVDYLDIAYD